MGFVVTAFAGGVGEERNGDSIQSLPHEFQKKPPAPGSARRPGGDGKTKAQSAVERSSEGCVWQVFRETPLVPWLRAPRAHGSSGVLGSSKSRCAEEIRLRRVKNCRFFFFVFSSRSFGGV